MYSPFLSFRVHPFHPYSFPLPFQQGAQKELSGVTVCELYGSGMSTPTAFAVNDL
jgi:hypothetical protein